MGQIEIPQKFNKSYQWYYDTNSLKINSYSFEFGFIAIDKHWRHVNSEGWEIYENQYHLHCTIQLTVENDSLKEISDICLKLRSTNEWSDTKIKDFLGKYKVVYVTSSYEEEVMIDCY